MVQVWVSADDVTTENQTGIFCPVALLLLASGSPEHQGFVESLKDMPLRLARARGPFWLREGLGAALATTASIT